jgi:uncharacterized lipoprotein YehR (DUF1307 family)
MKQRSYLIALMLVVLVVAVGCERRKRIEAMMWVGGSNEITREVREGDKILEEYIATDEEQFKDFRCFYKEDAARIIREALVRCPWGKNMSNSEKNDLVRFVREGRK